MVFGVMLWMVAGVVGRAALGDTVAYLVDVSHPGDGAFVVTMTMAAPAGDLVLAMPVFTPGGMIQNHARYVSRFRPVGAGGAPLPFRRTAPSQWTVAVPGPETVTVHYRVAPNRDDQLALVTNVLTDSGGYFHGATLLLYLPGHVPAALRVATPPGWQVVSPLRVAPDGAFSAPDYDDLAMAPVQFGLFEQQVVDAAPARLRLVFDRQLPPHDTAAFRDRIARIAASEAELMGEPAAPEYLVLFHWRPDLDYGGGVSRRGAVVMNIGADWMEDLAANLGPTFAHELFHTWNHGAIRPQDLFRPDFARANPTRFLWFVEGVTNYYVERTYARLQLLSERGFLSWLSQQIAAWENSPGRGWLSLAESDMPNWISSSEYVDASAGGHVAGFLFDVAIRSASHGTRSLDDVMRALFRATRVPDYRGFTERGFIEELSRAAGTDLGPLYRAVIVERGPFDYDRVLGKAGLRLRVTPGTPSAYALDVAADASDEERALLAALWH